MPFSDPVTGKVFVNLSEIAERWGSTVASVLRYHVGSGRMSSRRAGRAHYVAVSDLQGYEARLLSSLRARYDAAKVRFSQPLPMLPIATPSNTAPKRAPAGPVTVEKV